MQPCCLGMEKSRVTCCPASVCVFPHGCAARGFCCVNRNEVEVKQLNFPPAPLNLILVNIFMKLLSMKPSRHSVSSPLCSVFLIQL